MKNNFDKMRLQGLKEAIDLSENLLININRSSTEVSDNLPFTKSIVNTQKKLTKIHDIKALENEKL